MQARTDTQTIRPIAERWQVDHAGRCPTPQILKEDHELSASSILTDPWERPYRIECTNDEVRAISDGPDRRPGTKDDIAGGVPSNSYCLCE